MKICFVSSCLPRECGIATYTQNLMSAIKDAGNNVQTSVLAMNDDKYEYPSSDVIFQINENSDDDYKRAAEFINQSDIDAISLQHEFGIFGGFNGSKLLSFLELVKKPVIATMHTVPVTMDSPYKIIARKYKSRIKLLKKIFKYVSAITVMTNTAKKFLVKNTDITSNKVFVIPHGAPVFTQKNLASFRLLKENLGFEKDDFVISTFGLIVPKKGIEYVIKALPQIIKENPGQSIKYVILGRAHPKKPKDYIVYLRDLTQRLKLENNVLFVEKYLEYIDIYRYLANTDIYVTPYYSKEQASSGTLSYAIAAGRCIVSTPYIFAQDVINNYKVGEFVQFKDKTSIEKTINKLIKDPKLIQGYQENSSSLGKEIQWPKIGERFANLFDQIVKQTTL